MSTRSAAHPSSPAMSRVLPKIIVVAGTTGVGKSQLSIELARRFNGEVINSDAMQVYRGVPIVSNKHPLEEREGVPHHVMDYVPWGEEYHIQRFERDARSAIDDILRRGKVPVIVGGTHYYLQMLFEKLVPSAESSSEVVALSPEHRAILDSNDKDKVYAALRDADPTTAARFHPNDTHRVRRMLEIFYTTGTPPSETFAKQTTTLRYDTLFLWLYSDPQPLDTRLDARVDQMLKLGAPEEIDELYADWLTRDKPPCTGGVWQVIGFKEFLPWLQDGRRDDKLWQQGVDAMKLHTRQYARRQVKWIQKMLIPDVGAERVYVLNATDLTKWHSLVGDRAGSIAQQFMTSGADSVTEAHAPPELERLVSQEATVARKAEATSDFKRYTCNVCRNHDDEKLIAIGTRNWEIHVRSRRHKSNLNRGAKKAAYEKWKAEQNNE